MRVRSRGPGPHPRKKEWRMSIRIEERPVEPVVEGSVPGRRRRRGWTGIVLAGPLAFILVIGGGIGLLRRTGSGAGTPCGATAAGSAVAANAAAPRDAA